MKSNPKYQFYSIFVSKVINHVIWHSNLNLKFCHQLQTRSLLLRMASVLQMSINVIRQIASIIVAYPGFIINHHLFEFKEKPTRVVFDYITRDYDVVNNAVKWRNISTCLNVKVCMLDVTFLTRNKEYREGRYYLAQRKYITGLDIMSKLDHWEGRYFVAEYDYSDS